MLKEEDIQRALLLYTKIDILINNVGGGGRWGKEDPVITKEEVWTQVYNKNADIARRFTINTLPYMLKKRWGRVITIASYLGKEGIGRPWFMMAKAAEIALMKSLANHYRGSGVTFNSVAPGAIAIPDTANETEGGKPEDVAYLVSFLCSDKASYISGACIGLDGGTSRSF